MSQFNYPGAAIAVAMLSAISASNTAAATSAGVDLQAFEGPVLITQDKGLGTGTLTGKIQDSADNSAFADVTGLDFAAATTGVSTQKLVVQTRSVRRYIRYVGTVVTGPQLVSVSLTGVQKIV